METEVEPTTLPPLFRRHARRPRLTRLIDESKAQSIILLGPPGYGKTVLAREWAQGRDKIVWYRATSGSADVAAFSVGIAEVVSPLVPGAGERLRQRIRVGDPPEKAARPYAELLSQDLAAWPPEARLIIDDYHLVADSTPVEEFVDWLLTLTPSLRLIVTTRLRPAWVSAKRILHGEVTEIEKDQLAMTNEEAGRVLAGRTTETVRDLVRRAEGWPVLIGLAALAASSELPSDRISDALFRYFAEEVLRNEPPDVQEFMLLASIPGTISPRIASQVLDVESPEVFLAVLESQGLLDASGTAGSSFHPLVREFLRRKIAADEPELTAALSLRALDMARSARRWDEAFDLAVQSQTPRIAAEVVADAAEDLLSLGRIETLAAWLSACGSAVFDHPGAALAEAEILLRQGHLAETAALARDVAERQSSKRPVVARGWYIAGRAKYLLSQYGDALECHQRAQDAADTPSALKDALWGLLVTSSALEAQDANDYLDQLEHITPHTIDDRLRFASGRVTLACHVGSLAGVWAHLEPLLSHATQAKDPMAVSSYLTHAAYMCVARAEYPTALALGDRALAYCSELGLEFATSFCLVQEVGARIGLRDFTLARRGLDSLTRAAEGSEDPFLALERDILALKLALSQHAPHAASADLVSTAYSDLPRASHGQLLAFRALACVAAGETEQARTLSDQALSLTGSVEARYFANLAQLIASCIQGRRRADNLVEEVSRFLEAARADDFLDAVVVAYRTYPRFLRLAAQDASNMPTLRRLLRLARDESAGQVAGIPTPRALATRSNFLKTLTPREREIFSLLSEGLSNAEISRRLFIAPSTTKIHVRHVFRKLGVNNRVQAVLRARALEKADDHAG